MDNGWITLIAAFGGVITALGGWEFVKWFLNKKSNQRIAEATADDAETNAEANDWALLEKRETFMQGQLVLKEERIADLTERLRTEREKYIELMASNAKADIAHQKEITGLRISHQKEIAKTRAEYEQSITTMRIAHKEEMAKLTLEYALKRCDRKKCGERIPPNEY